MAQFDVFPNRGGNAELIPYLLDVQSDLLEPLRTRVVVPLVDSGQAQAILRLNPIFDIAERTVILSTQEIAAYPAEQLRGAIANLSSRRDDIVAAIDFLFQGF